MRTIVQSGVFEVKVKSIENEKIQFTGIRVNLIDKRFNVGTILFYSGEVKRRDDKEEKIYDKFESIQQPFGIINLIKAK